MLRKAGQLLTDQLIFLCNLWYYFIHKLVFYKKKKQRNITDNWIDCKEYVEFSEETSHEQHSKRYSRNYKNILNALEEKWLQWFRLARCNETGKVAT